MASPKIVRALFEERLKSGIPHPPGKFHPLDLERVRDDRYLMRIIAHVENNAHDALDMLWDILLWRATVGASDINETNIRMDYVKEGSIFPHGRDIDGCLLLVFRPKLYRKHKKIFEEVKKIMIYWFDRMEREENGNKISIFCDMSDHGMADFDMALGNFTATLFRKYYPHFFNYLVIFQTHWSLSSTLKLMKSLLPPRAASRMKIVNKNTLRKIVQLDHALKSWGGRDEYVYEFVPENKMKVTKYSGTKLGNDHNISDGMIHLKPNNTVMFRGPDNKLTFCMLLTITNTHESAVFFEIRITTPEIFCINPNSGTLNVSNSKSVVIVVQDYFDSLTMDILSNEKLIVLAIQIPNTEISQEELYNIWQVSPEFKVQEYMFRRLLNDVEDTGTLFALSMTELRTNNEKIQNQLYFLKLYQLLTLIVVTCAAFIFCFQHIWS